MWNGPTTFPRNAISGAIDGVCGLISSTASWHPGDLADGSRLLAIPTTPETIVRWRATAPRAPKSGSKRVIEENEVE